MKNVLWSAGETKWRPDDPICHFIWLQPRQPPWHQSTYFACQYKCKSHNVEGGVDYDLAVDCLCKMMLWKVNGSLNSGNCQNRNREHEAMSWLVCTMSGATAGPFPDVQSWERCIGEQLYDLIVYTEADLHTEVWPFFIGFNVPIAWNGNVVYSPYRFIFSLTFIKGSLFYSCH